MPRDEKSQVGLCLTCRQAKVVRTDRGSVFYQCQLAATDPRFARYPRLPVVQCAGYESRENSRDGGLPG